MSRPAPEATYLELHSGLTGDILRNKVSGETIRLQDRFQLRFNDSGAAFVSASSGGGGEPQWCRTLLQTCVMQDDEVEELFVLTRQSSGVEWASDLPGKASESKALELVEAGFKHSFLVYCAPAPKVSRCLRWALPHIVDTVLGSGFCGKWVSRHISYLEGVLEEAGLPPKAHLGKSLWSAKFGTPEPDATDFSIYEDEYNVTTEGLLCISLALSAGRVKSHGNHDKKGKAAALIAALVAKVLPRDGAPLRITHESEWAEFVMSPRRIALVGCHPAKKWRCRLASAIGATHIGAVLVELRAKVLRPSRSPSQVAMLRTIISGLCSAIAIEVEASRGDPIWHEMRVCELQPLFRTDSNRPRRIGIGYVLDVVDVVNSAPELRTSGQFLAAQAVVASRPGRGKQAKIKFMGTRRKLKPKSGQAFIIRKMLGYNKVALGCIVRGRSASSLGGMVARTCDSRRAEMPLGKWVVAPGGRIEGADGYRGWLLRVGIRDWGLLWRGALS